MTDTVPAVPSRADLEKAGIKIILGIPMERQVPATAFLNFWKIAQQGWPILPHPYGRVDVQRNIMANALLKHPQKFTHICMLDLDHIHPLNVVQRLARWVLKDPEKLVVGGLNFRRGEPFDPCVFLPAPDGELRPPLQWQEGIGEVAAIGHGAILISKKVFENVPGPWWAYVYQYFEKELFPSEDIYFSTLCNRAGIKIWCDTTTVSPHLIENTVQEDTFRAWIATHPEKIKMYTTDGLEADSQVVEEWLRDEATQKKLGIAGNTAQMPDDQSDSIPPMLGAAS